jgi:hypothetical protein
MSGGRPALDCQVHRVNVVLSLREGEDDDLIAWFDSLPRGGRSGAVMAALRSDALEMVGGGETAVSETAVADALADLMF